MMILGIIALVTGLPLAIFIGLITMKAITMCPTEGQSAAWMIIVVLATTVFIIIPAFNFSGLVLNGVVL